MNQVEMFDNVPVERFDIVSAERALNANFPTRVAAENGSFGRIEGLSQILERESGWSRNITDSIRSPGEFRIYQNAGLVDTEIGARRALVRNDINWHQTDEFGRTNLQRIGGGYSPLDTRNQPIELHHIGQNRNSPLAELTINEHRLDSGNSRILHTDTTSDVHRDGSNWQAERQQYWIDRANADITSRQTISFGLGMAHDAGVREGMYSAMIVGAITTVDNVIGVYNGEITVQEAAINISVDVGKAAALGYGAGFVSSAIATASSKSAYSAIRLLGNSGVPAAAVSFGIMSYDSVSSFAQGQISATELAHDLGENATGVAGAFGGAKIGAVAGSALGPVGVVAGGLVGGMVGYLVAVEAYATVIEIANSGTEVITDRATAVAETANALGNRAVETGQNVLDFVADNAPETLDNVRTALNDFAANLNVPLSFR